MATRAPRMMTVDEWAAMEEDEPGELVDGVLVEEEVADFVHEVVVGWLVRNLGNWVAPRGGLVGGSEAKYALAIDRGRKPDVSLYLPDSPKPPRRGAIRQPPDLFIEVISPRPRDARRDRIEKSADHARFGVRHFWLIEPETRIVECFRLNDEGHYVKTVAADGGRVTVPGFDGLELDLDQLWEETDRLSDDASD
jgi:Uma2 family endonuclease